MNTKAFFLFLYIFFILQDVLGQSISGEMKYKTNAGNRINSFVVSSSNIFSVGEVSDQNSSKKQRLFSSSDLSGNNIFENLKESNYTEFVNDCCSDKKGDFYIISNIIKSKTDGNVAVFSKISRKGEILFEREFPGGEKQIIHSLIKNPDDDFFVTGAFENKSDRDRDVWVLKLDKKGTRMMQAFSSNRYNEDAANCIVLTPEQEIITGGWIQNYKTKNTNAYFVKFNKYGQKIWEKDYGTEDYEEIKDMKLLPQGDLIAVGISINSFEKSDAFAIRIDKSGNLVWKKNFGGESHDAFNTLIIHENNVIAAGYSTELSTNNKQGWFVKLSLDGDFIGDYTLGDFAADEIQKIAALNASEIICAMNSSPISSGNSSGKIFTIPFKFEGTVTKPENNGPDKEPPVITIISPEVNEKDVALVEAGKMRQITGKVKDASNLLDVSVNGNKVTPNAEGVFLATLPQTDMNAKIRAIDQYGNYAEKVIYFTTGGKLEPLNSVISNISNFRRVALVIGNSKYRTAPLKNPVNDAEAIAAELKLLNFDVIKLTDVSYKDMKKGISEFGTSLAKDKSTIGLFYYAGHGIQLKGKNYIVPVDENISKEADVEVYAIELDDVMANLEYAGNTMNIIILDACRNNPFARSFRSATSSGLAATNAPVGTFVAYSTAPGSTAADGSGENGLYTQELLKTLKIPGLRIEDVFKKVRTSVKDISGGEQIPWENSALEGDFIFKTK